MQIAEGNFLTLHLLISWADISASKLGFRNVVQCTRLFKHVTSSNKVVSHVRTNFQITLIPTIISLSGNKITVSNKTLSDRDLEGIGEKNPKHLALCGCNGEKLTTAGLRSLFRSCAASLRVIFIVYSWIMYIVYSWVYRVTFTNLKLYIH